MEGVQRAPVNHGSSYGEMEANIAATVREHFQEKNNLRYTVFVVDGDDASYGRVSALKPYGKAPDDAIIKEDCVGHVQKRMGAKLRELKRTWKG